MSERYCCEGGDRRQLLIQRIEAGQPRNGIDFLEVVDEEALPLALRQRLLLVRCLGPLGVAGLGTNQLQIEGGEAVRDVGVDWASPLSALPTSGLAAVERSWLETHRATIAADPNDDPGQWLAARVDRAGDHSAYTLRLVANPTSADPPSGFDLILSAVSFSFKASCAAEVDCDAPDECPEQLPEAPPIDYLARDYLSARQMMMDRLAITMPEWAERSPADVGVALVELLAYAVDHLSYQQDAVATEAYLGTARRRTSARRHARMLDYRMHEGCAARAWVQLQLVDGQSGLSLPEGTPFLTRIPGRAPAVRPQELPDLLTASPEIFESVRAVERLSWAHNEIQIHTWGETRCAMPEGATEAALVDPEPPASPAALALAPGDVLIFEEVLGPATGGPADAAPARRHAVRLTEVTEGEDDLYGLRVWRVAWDTADALPFPLCLWHLVVGDETRPVAVARGNIVLVDHGRTLDAAPLPAIAGDRYRPLLSEPDLVWRAPWDPTAPASEGLAPVPRDALPAITLRDDRDDLWLPRLDLLASDPFDREFVVEMTNERAARLRFGDGVMGHLPTAGLEATYRVGAAMAGNVGAESIQHALSDHLVGALSAVRNPLPASGGAPPERLEDVRQYAPQAFRVQERAVTVDDWAEVAQRHPDVQRAVARLRWTGSWTTVFLTIDRRGGLEVDDAFRARFLDFLEPYRLAGVDLEFRPPTFVPLDIALVICVAPDHFRSDVKSALEQTFTSGLRRDGTPGFFHPDRFTFGQTLYLSQIVAAAMAVEGVAWVDTDAAANGGELVRFRRLGYPPDGELEAGRLSVGALEIVRLDNDANAADNGRLTLTMRGGR